MRRRAATEDGEGQILSIDLLRALAAVAIVVFHYKNFFRGYGIESQATLADLKALQWFEALGLLTRHGSLAVMLFWMISGFVLLHAYGARAGRISGRAYAVNRVSRLYPLHLATLLAVAAIQAVSMRLTGGWQIYQNNDLAHFAMQLLFASNWFTEAQSFNGPIWSVSAEIVAYGAFLGFLRMGAPSLPRIGAFGLGFGVLFAATGLMPALCGVYFFAGCAAHRAWRLGAAWSVERSAAFALAGGLAWGAGWAALEAAAPGMAARIPLTLLVLPAFGLGLLALAFAESLLRRRAPGGAALRLLAGASRAGDLTYASYLLHSPLQMLFLLTAATGAVPLEAVLSPAFAAGYLVVVFGLSWLAFRGFERPAQAWLRARLSSSAARPRSFARPAASG
ncbi:acyltransferase [Albimonas sp. CAU 1670]|uniref:acyltransferase family protein n=1 Tax=Albimonas sp. CAU 1670 TaxID=3032599 RepID=UPI0023DA29C2|nr:acyltransferase [Albimonas sp. CAU 1670]MDF2231631.1 acyltransferase [Albimonas sp. CAU 1670]